MRERQIVGTATHTRTLQTDHWSSVHNRKWGYDTWPLKGRSCLPPLEKVSSSGQARGKARGVKNRDLILRSSKLRPGILVELSSLKIHILINLYRQLHSKVK